MRTMILAAFFSLATVGCGTGDPSQEEEGSVEENFGQGHCVVDITTNHETGECWVGSGNHGSGIVCRTTNVGTKPYTEVKSSIPAVWVDSHTCLVNGD